MPPAIEKVERTPVTRRQALTVVMTAIVVITFYLTQRNRLNEYWLYFSDDRKGAHFELSALSEDWDESFLQRRFSEHAVSCYPYQGELPVDRACAVDVSAYNDVPTLFIAFFFADGRLHQVSINVAWWAHGKAYETLVAALGQPAISQRYYKAGARLHGWKLANGAAVFFNRERPVNPASWNGIYWRSEEACRTEGCFRDQSGISQIGLEE